MFAQAIIQKAKSAAAIAITAAIAAFSGNVVADTGQLAGTPIANARFISLDASGKITAQGFTTANGKFQFSKGDTVRFFVGDILLGKTQAAASVPTSALVSAAKNADALSNLVRFLQSVDTDLNSLNGIQVSNTTHTAAKGLKVNFDAAMKTFEVQAALAKVLALSTATPTLPEATTALTNFRMALLNAYNTSGQATVLNLIKTNWNATLSSKDCGTTTTKLTHNFNILGHVAAGNFNLIKQANGTCRGSNAAIQMALYENDVAFSCANHCSLTDLNRDVTLSFPVTHTATLVHEPNSNIITVVHHYEGRDVIETMVKK